MFRQVIIAWATILLTPTDNNVVAFPLARNLHTRKSSALFPENLCNLALVPRPYRSRQSQQHRWGGSCELVPLRSAKLELLEDKDNPNDDYCDCLFQSRQERVVFYSTIALFETLFWYYWAPGIDPDFRWFNPLDGELIASLLTPSIALSPPPGSGLGFSSLLLNSFLVLPLVWALLLLQEDSGLWSTTEHQDTWIAIIRSKMASVFRLLVCAFGFLVGGGALIPFMMFRESLPSRESIQPENFPLPLRIFEDECIGDPKKQTFQLPLGVTLILGLALIVTTTFLSPFFIGLECPSDLSYCNGRYDWGIEWKAFAERIRTSQFTSLALLDTTILSTTILDPILDDAIRRGFVVGLRPNETSRAQWRKDHRGDAIRKVAPFVLLPWFGPVAWICLRPRFGLTKDIVESSHRDGD